MATLNIEEIRKRYEHYGPNINCSDCAVLHVRQLLKEVDRLKAELIEALTPYYQTNLDKD